MSISLCYLWFPEQQAFLGDPENKIIIGSNTKIDFSKDSNERLVRKFYELIEKSEETNERSANSILVMLHTGPNDTPEKENEVEYFVANGFDAKKLTQRGYEKLVIITDESQLSLLKMFREKGS